MCLFFQFTNMNTEQVLCGQSLQQGSALIDWFDWWKCWCTGNVFCGDAKACYLGEAPADGMSKPWVKVRTVLPFINKYCFTGAGSKHSIIAFCLIFFKAPFKYAVAYFGAVLSKLSSICKVIFKHTFTWLCMKTELLMERFSTFHLFPCGEIVNSTPGYLSTSFSV